MPKLKYVAATKSANPYLEVKDGTGTSIPAVNARKIVLKKGLVRGTSPYKVEVGGQGVDFD